MRDNDEEQQKLPLARWARIVEPATLATKTGRERFVVTIKLPEKSQKTASSFVEEMNDAVKIKIETTPGCELNAEFVLVDSERVRLQRATAGFSTFKEARTCFKFLKELGLAVNDISAQGEITLSSQGVLLCEYVLQENNVECCLVTFGSYASLARMLFQQP